MPNRSSRYLFGLPTHADGSTNGNCLYWLGVSAQTHGRDGCRHQQEEKRCPARRQKKKTSRADEEEKPPTTIVRLTPPLAVASKTPVWLTYSLQPPVFMTADVDKRTIPGARKRPERGSVVIPGVRGLYRHAETGHLQKAHPPPAVVTPRPQLPFHSPHYSSASVCVDILPAYLEHGSIGGDELRLSCFVCKIPQAEWKEGLPTLGSQSGSGL